MISACSVLSEREQHQPSRARCCELHQPVCCRPLHPHQLQWLLRPDCAQRHGFLPADQPDPEAGPFPQLAEPIPPQRRVTSWGVFLSGCWGIWEHHTLVHFIKLFHLFFNVWHISRCIWWHIWRLSSFRWTKMIILAITAISLDVFDIILRKLSEPSVLGWWCRWDIPCFLS